MMQISFAPKTGKNDEEMLRDGVDLYFPCHFGGRFSENAFGPSM